MKLTSLFVLLFIAPFILDISEWEYHQAFNTFADTYGKTYSPRQIYTKYNTFKHNYDIVDTHNSQLGHTFRMKLNQFSDMEAHEFKKTYYGLIKSSDSGCSINDTLSHVNTSNLPQTVDWRTAGAVTPVKNQQQCGSCWAFSTTGAVEGINAIKTKKLVSVSEQQLVDCSNSFGNEGCSGGLMDNGFQYIMKNGICSEASVPYTAADGTCKPCNSIVKIDNCNDVPPNDENALKAATFIQPISVAIEADQSIFQFYSGGVMSDKSCGTNLDHGVLVVGYGTEGGLDYWLVKNSWGDTWGDKGYIKILRGFNVCGIAQQPSYPIA